MRSAEHSIAAVAITSIMLVAGGAAHAGETRDAVASTDASQRPLARHPQPVATVTTEAEPPADAPPPLDLSARVIKQAIADSRDPLDDVVLPRAAAFGSGPAGRADVDQAFTRAEIPTCMTTEAYRFDPPQVGPFGLAGMLALPFLVHAIVTGKCRH